MLQQKLTWLNYIERLIPNYGYMLRIFKIIITMPITHLFDWSASSKDECIQIRTMYMVHNESNLLSIVSITQQSNYVQVVQLPDNKSSLY